jgi:hypothetical protein
MLVNLGLSLIAVAIVALLPLGCIMTRGHGPRRGVATTAH